MSTILTIALIVGVGILTYQLAKRADERGKWLW